MTYQLILSEPKGEGPERDVGQNIFLDDLQAAYKVYVFYYPGAMPNEGLETKLQKLGQDAGTNLFVNIGKLDDPKYYEIAKKFGIKKKPVIIMTGIDGIASLNDGSDFSTVYVKLDNKDLFKDIESTVESIQRLFNLFIQGDIFQALEQGKKDNAFLKRKIVDTLRGIGRFLRDKDIEISLLEAKFAIKNKT
jgi:hypothetical protein